MMKFEILTVFSPPKPNLRAPTLSKTTSWFVNHDSSQIFHNTNSYICFFIETWNASFIDKEEANKRQQAACQELRPWVFRMLAWSPKIQTGMEFTRAFFQGVPKFWVIKFQFCLIKFLTGDRSIREYNRRHARCYQKDNKTYTGKSVCTQVFNYLICRVKLTFFEKKKKISKID